jgi:hypothetical protein
MGEAGSGRRSEADTSGLPKRGGVLQHPITEGAVEGKEWVRVG